MRHLCLLVGLLLCLCAATPAKEETAAGLVKRAETLFQQGKARECLELLNRAIKLDPKYADAYHQRGILYLSAGEGAAMQGASDAASFYSLAESDLALAVKLNPKLAIAWANLGTCHYRQGQLPKAVSDFDRAIALDSKRWNAYSGRAGAYSKLNKDPLAIGDYTRAYELTGDAKFLFNRGNCYMRLNQVEKARADYELVLKKSKDPRILDGARNNLEALKTGSTQKPSRPR